LGQLIPDVIQINNTVFFSLKERKIVMLNFSSCVKIFTTCAVSIILLTGCVSKQERAARTAKLNNDIKTQQNALAEAINNSIVTCDNKASCEKAFSLTKIYVREHSYMKIQFSDDTIINTYNPTKAGYIGMSATKVPDVGDTAKIKLSVNCEGLNWIYADTGGLYGLAVEHFFKCSNKVIPIYKGFKPYVESKL
jgi:hypothetical protein